MIGIVLEPQESQAQLSRNTSAFTLSSYIQQAYQTPPSDFSLKRREASVLQGNFLGTQRTACCATPLPDPLDPVEPWNDSAARPKRARLQVKSCEEV